MNGALEIVKSLLRCALVEYLVMCIFFFLFFFFPPVVCHQFAKVTMECPPGPKVCHRPQQSAISAVISDHALQTVVISVINQKATSAPLYAGT